MSDLSNLFNKEAHQQIVDAVAGKTIDSVVIPWREPISKWVKLPAFDGAYIGTIPVTTCETPITKSVLISPYNNGTSFVDSLVFTEIDREELVSTLRKSKTAVKIALSKVGKPRYRKHPKLPGQGYKRSMVGRVCDNATPPVHAYIAYKYI